MPQDDSSPRALVPGLVLPSAEVLAPLFRLNEQLQPMRETIARLRLDVLRQGAQRIQRSPGGQVVLALAHFRETGGINGDRGRIETIARSLGHPLTVNWLEDVTLATGEVIESGEQVGFPRSAFEVRRRVWLHYDQRQETQLQARRVGGQVVLVSPPEKHGAITVASLDREQRALAELLSADGGGARGDARLMLNVVARWQRGETFGDLLKPPAPRERELLAIVLRDRGFDEQTVALEMGCDRDTARQHLFRVRKKLAGLWAA